MDLGVPDTTNPDTTNPATIKAIKTALQTANPTLTTDDLTKIKFDEITLQAAFPTEVTATITVGYVSERIALKVTWLTPQTLAEFKKQLQALPKSDLSFYTMDFHKNPDGNYYSQNLYNAGIIGGSIGASLPGYKGFAVGLSFTGQMVVGQTSNIEVYYNHKDLGITIPITLTVW